MEKLVYNSANNETVPVNSRAWAPGISRSAIKKLLLVLIIIVEIESVANEAIYIYNTSMSRIIAGRGKQAVIEVAIASGLVSAEAVSDTACLKYKHAEYLESIRYKGPVLSKSKGTVMGPSGKETYYNLNMNGVVKIMRRMGNNDEYWVREDGVKMLGDYVMVAANLNLRPRGSLVETSLGTGIVCDTGGFAAHNPTQLDIAVTW